MRNLIVLAVLILSMVSCSKEDVTPPPPPIDENMLPTEFRSLYQIFDGQGIGAATNINDDIMLFFSADGLQFAWFEDQEIKRTGRIDEEGGLFDGIAFSAVGGAIDFDEERVIFFNKVGGTYQWSDLDPNMVKGNSASNSLFQFKTESFGLWEWGPDNSCPFLEAGAMMGFSKEPQGCTSVGDDDDFLWIINKDGDELVRYRKIDAEFDESVELERWRSESVCGGAPTVFPMSTIGAVCVYEPDGEDYKELFFSKDGTEMVILNGTKGTFSEVFSLK